MFMSRNDWLRLINAAIAHERKVLNHQKHGSRDRERTESFLKDLEMARRASNVNIVEIKP